MTVSVIESAQPSRLRTTPSGAVAWAYGYLKQNHFRLETAVDLGCGRGRNTLFLARKGLYVTAMDFTPNAIETLLEEAQRQEPAGNIRALVHDIVEDWPIRPNTIDLVVDSFCFKHLDSDEAYHAYKANLLRVLAPHGHYLISLASIGDGYYGRYIRRSDQEAMPADDVVDIDPIEGIESALYTREKVIAFLKPELSVCAELKHTDHVRGPYEQEAYALLFQRRS